MAKVNFKQVLLDKGERYAFFAAGGLMLVFMVIGLVNLSDSPDTDKFVADVEQNTKRINTAINAQSGEAPVLPDHARRIVAFPSVRMATLDHLNFDPINPPDTKRTNPTVKQISEIQADFVWVKMPAFDIKEADDGKRLIGVRETKGGKTDNVDKDQMSVFAKQLASRMGGRIPKKRPNPAPMGFMGGGPLGASGGVTGNPGIMGGGPLGAAGGATGYPGFMGGGPTGAPGGFAGNSGFMGGGPGPSGGVAGNLGGGAPGPTGTGMLGDTGTANVPQIGGMMGGRMPQGNPGNDIGTGEREFIDYIPLEADKLEGKRLAITIYPQRLVIIHAAFPYREQVEEFRRALRFKEAGEIVDPKNDVVPTFKGFLIQRRILYPDGRPAADWHYLNYESYYKDTIYPRAISDQTENPDLAYVKLPPESEFVVPLPSLEALKGTYPEVTIKSIWNTIQNYKDLNKPPSVPKSGSRKTGDGSIFGNNKLDQSGLGNQPNSPDFNIPKKGKGMGMDKETGTGNTGSTTVQLNDLPESVLIRLIDNDIIPGRLYQYRMKVLMQNPNWAGPEEKGKWQKDEKFELVSQKQDAKRMLIGASEEDKQIVEQKFFADIKDEKVRADEVRWNVDKKNEATPWFQMNGFVNVPQEEFIFAIDPPLPTTPDPKEPKKTVGGVTLKPGEGLLQFQKWMPTANIKGYKEPVADWVVADVLAKKGYYLGGEQFVNLPIWSSEFNRYILRKVPADKDAKQKESKRGVVMDPTKPGPRYAVIDVEGGTINRRIGIKQIDDEAATEILLADEEGNLYVRSSAYDRNSLNRYMPDPKGPYVIHNGGQVTRFQPNGKYGPDARRVLDREEVWTKWVEETDKASRSVDPETGTGGAPKKFD